MAKNGDANDEGERESERCEERPRKDDDSRCRCRQVDNLLTARDDPKLFTRRMSPRSNRIHLQNGHNVRVVEGKKFVRVV